MLKKNSEDKIPLSLDQYGYLCHPFIPEPAGGKGMPLKNVQTFVLRLDKGPNVICLAV